MKAAGRHRRCTREVGYAAERWCLIRKPRRKGAVVEGRDSRGHRTPGIAPTPDHSGAARPQEPLVAAGDEEVAAEIGRRRRLDSEAVHAVDAEEDSLVRRAIAVDRPEGVGNPRIGSFTPVLE